MAKCTDLYYFPEKDTTQTIECTATKCDHYELTDFGYECKDYSSLATYITLGVIGGLAVIFGIIILSVHCCNKYKEKKAMDTDKLIENAASKTKYVEDEKKKA